MTTERTAWRSRIIGHGEEPPDQLLANPKNWRIHPKEQERALGSVLDAVGWVQDVIVNRRTGHLIDGHLRVSAAISRSEPTVPVVYVDLDEDEEALILATLDPLGAMATTDREQLADLMADVTREDGAVRETLERVARQEHVTLAAAGLTDPEAVPEVSPEPYVCPGDLWALGDHRLLCGDATSAEDVARVLGGERPALMVTDPPYGVNYDPTWREGALRTGAVTNDDRADWTEAWALSPSAVAYVWHAARFAALVQSNLEACGFEQHAQIIWRKTRFPMSRGHYHWRHEPCLFMVRRGETARWIGDRRQNTVWDVSTLPTGVIEATAVPVLQVAEASTTVWDVAIDESVGEHGMERPLRNHEGDVFDPFIGSGTTIIAAERQRRRCFAMEIAPRYAQVALERWQNYTGRTAELLERVDA